MTDEDPLSTRILLVDDDEALVAVLTDALSEREYEVSAVGTGNDALHAIPEQYPDLIVLDLGLPDDDGLVLLPSFRKLTKAPIIVLSARDTQSDRVLSLKLGADDFMSKPFDLMDLDARIEAVLRRMPALEPVSELRAGDIVITPSRARVVVGSTPIYVTRTEYRLVSILVTHVDETVTRGELLEKVWGYQELPGEHLIEVHVGRLRKKLREAGSVMLIETMRNRGYMLANSKGVS
jgi:two-component system OmpR family response regulator